MTFDLFDTIQGQGVPCTTDMLMATIDTQKMRDRVQAVRDAVGAGRKDEASRLKKRLPAVTWQAHFPDGKRRSEGALSSGLYMLDIDGVEEVEKTIDAIIASATEQCLLDQIVAVHISPSGKGIRVVAVCSDPARDTIEKNQAWLAEKLGILSYDEACKDFARLAFLVAYEDFRYLNLDLLASKPRVALYNPQFSAEMTSDVGPQTSEAGENDNAVSKANTSTPSLGGGRGRLFTDEQLNFCYRGMRISEIAQKYLEYFGRPMEGERNTYYYNMCVQFRYITDYNTGILLAQLPDLGLTMIERQKTVEGCIKRSRAGRIPYPFWKFLESLGLVSAVGKGGKQTSLADEEERLEKLESLRPQLPNMPVVFREYCNAVPEEFRWPMTAALLPILGTLATRIRATYIDDSQMSPTFHSVIIAPASSGKSIFAKAYYQLTEGLSQRDAVEWAKERLYQMEVRRKKNAKTLPEKPHTVLRLLQPSISVPKLLERQQDAEGLHQLTFTPEVDTLAKTNRGKSGMDKNDMYRQAWDNDWYGQDYMMSETFSGNVQLFQNFLLTGTPRQVKSFYGDPENGLVSRVMFAHINGQKYAVMPKFKKFTAKQQGVIERSLKRLEDSCYQTLENGKEIICPVRETTSQMRYFYDPIAAWLERKRLEAAAEDNEAKDNFRKRAAVKAFRAAMLAVALYKDTNTNTKKLICDWALWIADMDLEEHVNMYGLQMMELSEEQTLGVTVEGILKLLDDKFSLNDVAVALKKDGRKSQPSSVISNWKKTGLVEKTGKGLYQKTSKGKEI